MSLVHNLGYDLEDPLQLLCFGQPSYFLIWADSRDPLAYYRSSFPNLRPGESSSARLVVVSTVPVVKVAPYRFHLECR